MIVVVVVVVAVVVVVVILEQRIRLRRLVLELLLPHQGRLLYLYT